MVLLISRPGAGIFDDARVACSRGDVGHGMESTCHSHLDLSGGGEVQLVLHNVAWCDEGAVGIPCSDIKAISKICKAHNAGLFVDEAHGAHFPFSTYFPDSALSCGADVTVTSLHKTLPALTQTALLLTNDLNICGGLQKMLAVFQTSSPSYVLMSSVETCLDYVQNNSFDNYTAQLRAFQADMKRLNKLRLLLREGIARWQSLSGSRQTD